MFKSVIELVFAGAPLHAELITETAESKSHCFSLSLASFGLFSEHEMFSQSALHS